MGEFKMGEKVEFKSTLRRRCLHNKKEWVAEPNEGRGIWIGWRTLSNGSRVYGYETGYEYKPKEFFRAEVIAVSPRRKPVLVRPEATKSEGENG